MSNTRSKTAGYPAGPNRIPTSPDAQSRVAKPIPIRAGTPVASHASSPSQQAAQLVDRLQDIVKGQLEEALHFESTGQTARSSEALAAALLLTESCQLQQLFLQQRSQIAPLLQRALETGVAPNYTRELLNTMDAGKKASVFTGKGVLIEPLSAREVEILQLVSEGLRNKEIAEQLSISISTVKAHLYNVFSKLQSRSRTEAVSLGRDMGII